MDGLRRDDERDCREATRRDRLSILKAVQGAMIRDRIGNCAGI